MTTSLTLLSPAKLNLFLHITGRRTDGYHNLQTVFQLLDYGDNLSFHPRHDNTITLSPELAGVVDQDNLIIKAAHLLQKHTQCTQGVDIHCEKHLPMRGGLGGGSSNAATTLVALNHLWDTSLTAPQLAELGLQLGADVPVFIYGHSAWAEGVGEQLHALELPDNWFLVIKPQCHINTAEIFSHEELTRDTAAITVAAFFEQGGKNDCEPVVCQCYPEVAAAIAWLNQHSAAQLTGTGACIFARFADLTQAEAVRQQVPEQWECFVAKGINRSPMQTLLCD